MADAGAIEEWKLDFEYVRDCKDKRELRKIVKRLRAEPFYPDLQKLAEKKLAEVDPSSKLLNKPKDATEEERNAALGDLDMWVESIQKKDQRITNRAKSNASYVPSVPPIRGSRAFELNRKRKMKPNLATLPSSEGSSRDASKDIWGSAEPVASAAAAASASAQPPAGDHRSKEELEFVAQNFRVQGNEAFRRKEYAKALKLYGKSVDAMPSEAALTNSALMNLKLSRHDDAEKDCTRALELNGASAKAYLRRGLARKGLGRFAGAIADLERALKLVDSSKHAQVERHLEACEAARDKHAKAELKSASYSSSSSSAAAMAKNAAAPTKMTRMAITEDDDDDDEEEDDDKPVVRASAASTAPAAKTRRMQIVEADDDDDDDDEDDAEPVMINRKTTEQMRAEQKGSQPAAAAAAAAAAASAVAADAKVAPVAPAEAAWPASIKAKVQEAEAMKKKAAEHYKASRYDAASTVLARAAEIVSSCRSAQGVRGSAAEARLAELLGAIHANRGACASQSNHYEEAVKACSCALEVAPASPSASRWRLRRAQAYESLDMHHEALVDMARVQQSGTGSVIASKAIPRLRRVCKEENPGRILAEKRRGNAHYKAKRLADAAASYERALALATSPHARYADTKTTAALYTNLALCRLGEGKMQAAADACTRALGLPGEGANPSALRRRAMAYKALSKPGAMLADLKAAERGLQAQLSSGAGNPAKTQKLLAATRKEIEKATAAAAAAAAASGAQAGKPAPEVKKTTTTTSAVAKPATPVVQSAPAKAADTVASAAPKVQAVNTTTTKQVPSKPKAPAAGAAPAAAAGAAASSAKRRMGRVETKLEGLSRDQLREFIKAPRTALEARTALKSIAHDSKLVAEWVEVVPPKQFWKLFKSAGSLEMDHLCAIVRALSAHCVRVGAARTLQVLRYLAKSSRFALNIAMVDEETTEALETMFKRLEAEADKGVEGLDAVEIESIKDKYL